MSDLRSECDPCADPALDFDTAWRCPCSVPELLAHLRDAIVADPGALEGTAVVTLKVPVNAGVASLVKDVVTRQLMTPTAHIDVVAVLPEHDPPPKEAGNMSPPLFRVAAGIALVTLALRQPVCVYVPPHFLGVPGTSLTVRRALRCVLGEGTFSGGLSAADLDELMRNLRLFIGPPLVAEAIEVVVEELEGEY